MFARKFRLPSSQAFENARMLHTPLFVLKVVSNNLTYNRYGFVSAKSIDKRAVVRNRLKRRVRAVVEGVHEKLKQGNDLLFILRKEGVEMDAGEIKKIIEQALTNF